MAKQYTPEEKQQIDAAYGQEQMKRDATLIMQLLGRQFGFGGLFGTNPELERLVGNYGGNTLLDNVLRKSDLTVVNGYAQSAALADQSALNNTAYNALIAARNLTGTPISEEERAQYREQAATISSSLPMIIGVMKSAGMDTSMLENAISSAYGKKGSTQQLYNQAVPALSRYMSTGSAARLAGHLTAGQYGSAWNLERVRGISAQDLGSAINFMSHSGGYNRQSFWHGGFGLSNMGITAQRLAKAGLRGETLEAALTRSYDQRAVDMAGSIYATELHMKGRDSSLFEGLPKDYIRAYGYEDSLSNKFAEFNAKRGLNLTFDRNATQKDMDKMIDDQFKAAIDKAEKDNDKKLSKKLEAEKSEVKAAVKLFYGQTSITGKDGKTKLTYQQLAKTRAQKANQRAATLISGTVIRMQQELAAIAVERQEAESIEDEGERNEALKAVRQKEADFERYKYSSDLTMAAARVLDSPVAFQKALDTAQVGMHIKSAFGMQGKQVTLDEALAASKALTGGSMSGIDTKRFAKDVARTLSAVVQSGGNIDTFFSNSQAFTEKALALGLDRDAVARINLHGERAGTEYSGAGMSDEDAAAQTMRDKNNMAVTYNAAIMRGLRGIEHVLGTSEEMTKAMEKDASPEELALLQKIKDKRDFNSGDYRTANVLMNRMLRRAFNGDVDAMNDMLDNTQASDYALRQNELLTNADFFWMGSTRFKNAMGQLQTEMDSSPVLKGTVINENMKDAAWTLLAQNAPMIHEILGKTSDGTPGGLVALHREQILAGSKLAESLNKNELTRDMGSALGNIVNKARETGNTDELMRFMRSVGAAHKQTELDPAALAAKATREAVGDIKDLQHTALGRITSNFTNIGKATLSDILAAAANGDPTVRRQAIYDAFQLTDPVKIAEQIGDDSKGIAAMADALVLNGNVQKGPGTLHNGRRVTLTDDEIKAAQEFLSHPEYQNLTEAELKGKTWHSAINGDNKVTFYQVAKMAQAAREVALSNIGLGNLEIADEYNVNPDVRNSSPRVLYNRAVAARQRELKEKEGEVVAKVEEYQQQYDKDTLHKKITSTSVTSSTDPTYYTDFGESVAKIGDWLGKNAKDAEVKAMGSQFSTKQKDLARQERENQDKAYKAEKAKIEEDFKNAKAAAAKETDPEKQRQARLAAESSRVNSLRELDKKYTLITDPVTKKKVYTRRKASMRDIVGTEAGLTMYNMLKTAEEELLKTDERVMTDDQRQMLSTVQTQIAKYERFAREKAEEETVAPVGRTDYLFNEAALDPTKYKHLKTDLVNVAAAKEEMAGIDESLKQYGGVLPLVGEKRKQYNALKARKADLQKIIDEDKEKSKERSDQLGWLTRVGDNLAHDRKTKTAEELKKIYEPVLKAYKINTGDAEKDIDLLERQLNFDQENFKELRDEKGKVIGVEYDTSLGGTKVGTQEGAEMYKALRDKERDNKATAQEKRDMRRYERRLAEWIELHPEEAKAAGFEVKKATVSTKPASYLRSEDNSKPELTPDPNLAANDLNPGAGSGSPSTSALAENGETLEINDSNIVSGINNTNTILDNIYKEILT